jgi:hypothetical protein
MLVISHPAGVGVATPLVEPDDSVIPCVGVDEQLASPAGSDQELELVQEPGSHSLCGPGRVDCSEDDYPLFEPLTCIDWALLLCIDKAQEEPAGVSSEAQPPLQRESDDTADPSI